MKQLFVIGSSGVGKTILCKKLTDIERNVVHISFDDQVNLLLNVQFLSSDLAKKDVNFGVFVDR